MILRRLGAPVRVALSASKSSLSISQCALDFLRVANASTPSPVHTQVRHATHATAGIANGTKNGAGRRLGAKKGSEEYVVPGCIIFRQRGTKWHPGENCDIGRDHTIYATQPGYVKFYRDPLKHKKRKYIGVTFERHWTLPTPPNAPRRRRLGMLAVKMGEDTPEKSVPQQLVDEDAARIAREGKEEGVNIGGGLQSGISADPAIGMTNIRDRARDPFWPWEGPQKPAQDTGGLKMSRNYQYRVSNAEIGRAAQKKGIKVQPFDRSDRWLAWRKTTERLARKAELRAMGKGKKKKKPAVKATA
ncbi:hypothetical protein K402DRAFT_425433 [Aulographum hederae CBS 113979]|uniref:Large ribosomal subunit protein bL27m n=1 Tax=Aulographum hederae CBS 113979 TaxID=1176131 RepID=A0A6G1GKU7_9PEZI|nr:hypothetical protein K402DRAFT_425433 [Aulographum hederae CBS 113979]